MKPRTAPPLLIGLALLFWGSQTGMWIVAVPAAVLAEGLRFGRRWDLQDSDFSRVSYLCTAALIGITVYALVTQPLTTAVMTTKLWVPLVCLPLLLAQRLTTNGGIPAVALLPLLNRRLGSRMRSLSIDVSYPYLVFCVLGASAANQQTVVFYLGTVLIAVCALWSAKPRTASAAPWVFGVAAAAVVGYAAHIGLHAMQGSVERAFGGYVPGSGSNTISSVRNTAIGSIGTLKLSARIAMRVRPQTGRLPVLLHSATFTSYSASSWVTPGTRLTPLRPGFSAGLWQLGEPGKKEDRVRISTDLSGGTAWVPIPDRAVKLNGLNGVILRRDPYGSVQIEDGASLAEYDVAYGDGTSSEDPPEKADLFVHPTLQPLFAGIARDLNLETMTPHQRVEAVGAFFNREFRYSLYQPDRDLRVEPLEEFLTKTRAGHCEYFATSTVLLLRSAGIPARYAVGHAVEEWNAREQAYLVRDRHAHAWARIYVDGNWEDLDTTPASWATAESARASFWQPLQDWLAWRWYQLRASLPGIAGGWKGRIQLALFLVATALVLWSIRSLWKKRSRKRGAASGAAALPAEGADSEFYKIEAMLEKAGFGRRAAESMQMWIQRLEGSAKGTIATEPLRALLALHYRYRFDPHGLRSQDRARLKVLANSWIAAHRHLRTKTDIFLSALPAFIHRNAL
jgi:transglutaminase-like putative cysteine protease